MDENIRQIVPATGWRVVSVSYDDGDARVHEEPVVCFALLEPPYVEPEDGRAQPVVPMIRERGSWPTRGTGTFDIVIGDVAYWENQRADFQAAFVGYLSPDETLDTPWVKEGVELARKHWLG